MCRALAAGLLTSAILLAQSRVLKEPYLQNVEPTSITIMWETEEAEPSRLAYGKDPTDLQWIAFLTPVTIHELRISGLRDDCTYYFRTEASSELRSFRTAPAQERPWRFSVYGDSRTFSADHAKVCSAILQDEPEIVLHMGDLVTDGRVYDQWQAEWYEPAAELLALAPMYPVPGNHEYQSAWYYRFFSLPQDSSGTESWYAFARAGALFIGLDTTLDFSPGSNQYQWLEAVLSQDESTFKVLSLHHAPFTSGIHQQDQAVANVRNHLVPLFESHQVDLVFAGHDHHYERSAKDGIQYVISGGGGAELRNPNLPNPYSLVKGKFHQHCSVDIAGGILSFRCL
ncbi:MAG: purple acid phosphatase family protein, partial [Planctomycetota bacterium]